MNRRVVPYFESIRRGARNCGGTLREREYLEHFGVQSVALCLDLPRTGELPGYDPEGWWGVSVVKSFAMSAARHSPPHPSRGGDVPASIRKAATDGQAGAVLVWLDGGGRVDERFECTFACGTRVSGVTLLMLAMTYGHAELAEALLRRGADVSLQSSNGGTALSLAALNGREKMVELALRHGVEVDQKKSNGVTALMDAAYRGHERIVDTLIRHGAEIDMQANKDDTALMAAALGNHPAVVLRLLLAGADMTLRSSGGRTALQYAKEKGHGECVEAVRTHLGEVTAVRSKAPSAEAGGAGAGGAPAGEAAAGASDAASALIGEGGAEAEPSSETVPEEVVLAAKRGEEAVVLAWLDGGGWVDERFECTFACGTHVSGMTLLMVAMSNGHAELAEALLRHGADISLQNSNGSTALMFAAVNGREKMVELALRARRGDRPAKQVWRRCADGGRLRRPRACGPHADPARRGDRHAGQQRRHRSDARRALRPSRRGASAAAGGRRHDVVQ